MQPLGPTLKHYRLQRQLTLQQLAKLAGCSKAYLSTIENTRRPTPPKTPILRALEKALNLTPGQLTQLADWQATPQSIKQEFNRLTSTHPPVKSHLPNQPTTHSLPNPTPTPRRPDGSRDLDALFHSGKLHQQAATPQSPIDPQPSIQPHPPNLRSIPLINKVAAGYPTEFTDLDYPASIADAYVPCPNLDDPHAFAASVVGQSMTPLYQPGQTIIFSPATDPTDGHDCFVRILPDHHTTFKRVFFQNDQTVRLQPLNPNFPTTTLPLTQLSGLYPAIMRIEHLNPSPD